MRILVVFGIVIRDLALWRACAARGVEVHAVGDEREWASVSTTERERYFQDIKVHFLDLKRLRPHGDEGLWSRLQGLRRVIASTKPDLIHVLSEPWGVRVIQALLSGDTRYIKVCAHGVDNVYTYGGRIERTGRRLILSLTLPRLDGFVSWNEDGIRLARQHGLSSDCPSVVIPAQVPDPHRFVPVSEERRRALRIKFGLPPEGVIAGFFGRLIPEKGIHDVFQAFRLLEKNAPFLFLWGSGVETTVISGLAGGITGQFGGHLPRDDVPDALQCCDIVLVPSKRTNSWIPQFERTALEAMVSGCAVIAYESGELPRVVADGGALVPEGDIDALASEIGSLTQDPERRSVLGRAARNRALERFAPDVVAEKMISFWSRVVRVRRV